MARWQLRNAATRSPFVHLQVPGLHQLLQADEGLSADTVSHWLRSAGLCAHWPYVGPILTDQHRNECWSWAVRYHHWSLQHWHGVLFFNHSSFHLKNVMVSCWCGGGMENVITMTTVSDMEWGKISYHHHRTALHVCHGRMNAIYHWDNILQKHVIPLFHQHQGIHIFQQHNIWVCKQ